MKAIVNGEKVLEQTGFRLCSYSHDLTHGNLIGQYNLSLIL